MPVLAERPPSFEPQTAWVPAQVALDLASIEVRPAFDIDPLQLAVIGLISQGRTLNQAAKETSLQRSDVIGVEKDLQAELGVRNTSAVVDRLIISGILPIELETDDRITDRLTHPDRSALRSRASGLPDQQIARSLGLTINQFIKGFEADLHYKLEVKKRPQSIRRAHELGILRIAGVPPSQPNPVQSALSISIKSSAVRIPKTSSMSRV
jgi:DNA-binding CsgD family transcriptional regulator